MSAITQQMLTIQALDPEASLKLSDYTRKWYVAADIAISNHVIIRWLGRHRDTPDQAVAAFLEELTSHAHDEVVVTNEARDRREWKWNGAAWAAIPVPESVTP